jgi:hypothetical protein
MQLAINIADTKHQALLFVARASLRVADRLLRSTFRGFRAGYLPLGILRIANRIAEKLRRLSLRCWDLSRGPSRLATVDSEERKPLPECLTRLLAAPPGKPTRMPARH